MKQYRIEILRRDTPSGSSYSQEFLVKLPDEATVLSALEAIRRRPLNEEDVLVAPVVFESGCGQGRCGACAMTINGDAGFACSQRLQDLGSTVTLAPLERFSVIRDLCVDRKAISNKGERPYVSLKENLTGAQLTDDFLKTQDNDVIAIEMSACLGCGVCVSACPQFSTDNSFVGPMSLSQYYLASTQNEKSIVRKTLVSLTETGFVTGCDNTQNCVRACPIDLPLVDAIGKLKRNVFFAALQALFS